MGPDASHHDPVRGEPVTDPIQAIPILQDNYAYALRIGPHSCAIVDPGDSAPILHWLHARYVRLEAILVTHHHGDHTGGIAGLVANVGNIPVYGPVHAQETITGLTHPVRDGDHLILGAEQVRIDVIGLPGHTRAHLGYYAPHCPVLFVGDCLFPLGCGRTFTGDYAAHFASIRRIADLPDATRLCAGHEYTLANARFAYHQNPTCEGLANYIAMMNDRCAHGRTTHPHILGDEKIHNPFLTAHSADQFALLRRAKDRFASEDLKNAATAKT